MGSLLNNFHWPHLWVYLADYSPINNLHTEQKTNTIFRASIVNKICILLLWGCRPGYS